MMTQLGSDYSQRFPGRRQLEEDYARFEQFYSGEADDTARSEEMRQPAEGYALRKNISETERLVSMGAGAGMVVLGLVRGRLSGLLLSGLGGALVWRGYTGRCQCYAALGIDTAEHNPATAVPAQQGQRVEKTITIRRSPDDLFRFWRKLENLPQIMANVKHVQQRDSQRSHWVAIGPLGKELQWDAEIHNERANEMIAWRSLPGGDIDTAGSIHFRPAEQAGLTEVTLSMKYNPPAGKVGARLADLIGDGLEQKLDEDLQRFKKLMESAGAGAPLPRPSAHV
jgi:uncharacterized membrane protein